MAILKRVLVATDFSHAARLAVWRAAQLAKLHDAELYLVHARPDWNLFSRSSSAAGEHYRNVFEHAEDALKAELDYVSSAFGIRVRGETRMGRASEALTAALSEVQPHLVVIGARGEHGSPPVASVLGGTALKLVAQTNYPLLLVRKAGSAPYAVGVAAVDASRDVSRRLVDWTICLLGQGGECHVVHAFDAPYVERLRAQGVVEAVIEACTEEARRAAQNSVAAVLEAPAATPERRLHTHLVCGEPISAILAEIDRCRPEFVVVGKHKSTPRESPTRFVGTVALRLAYHAPSDVLVVP